MSTASVAAVLCGALAVSAGDGLTGFRSGDAPAGASRRVFVMKTGRVEEGIAVEAPGGYQVHGTHGSVLLPSDLIEVVAASRKDAYYQLRDDLRPRDGTGRVKLAEWCLNNGLPNEARTLVLQALEVEPDRDDWRVTLTAIERRIASTRPAPPPAVAVAAARGSAGGLSREVVRDFNRFAQRTLLTRCANGGCHGDATASHFQLTQPARTAAVSARNLRAVLPFVGGGGAWDSPLLTACAARSDARGRTPFFGPRGEESRRALAAWVARVAAERPPAATVHVPAVRAPPVDGGVVPASAESDVLDTPDDERPVRPDAFDPHAFNRRYAAPLPGAAR